MRPHLRSYLTPARMAAGFRLAVLGVMLWVAVRHWHSYYGFTRFLQIDPLMAQEGLPVIRDQPIYVHDDAGSYDGGYYAQIATSPALRDPALRTSIDDLGYRARRILLSAAAWALGRGDPVAAMRAYAGINVVLWFVFAAVLWRVFPPDGRGTLAWTLVLLSAGVLFSVRYALTDLAALLLTAGALLWVEAGRPLGAGGLLGLGALARETVVLGAAALLPGTVAEWRQRPVARLAGAVALTLLPLAIWLAYIHDAIGGTSSGQRNLGWPLEGWWGRWAELWGSQEVLGNPRLQLESALEHVTLTLQVAYLLWRPRWSCPWWRLGAAYVLLLAVMGPAVWGGFPNAASRVLLPLTLAFTVRVVRDRAPLAWLLAGSLSVFAGLHAFAVPPGSPHELPASSTWHRPRLLETDARWSVAEWNARHRWAWCGDSGGLVFRALPWPETAQLELQVRGRTPRDLEVWHAGRRVWRGPIGDRPQWITLPSLPFVRGRLELELRSSAPPVAEGADNTARQIGIACFGARLRP